MPEGGFVKLWRKITVSATMPDKGLAQLWTWCMAQANWKDTVFKGVPIPAGSFVCNMRNVAEALCEPKSTIAWRFDRLQYLGQAIVTTHRFLGQGFTVITLCNWKTYQLSTDSELDADWTPTPVLLDTDWTPIGHIREEVKKGRTTRTQESTKEQARAPALERQVLLLPDLGAEPKAEKTKRTYLAAFEEFWAAYPRKAAKHKASAAYLSAVKRLSLAGVKVPDEYLLERAKAFAASETGRGEQRFIAFGSTWLNEARYEDDDQVWNCTQKQQPRAARSFD